MGPSLTRMQRSLTCLLMVCAAAGPVLAQQGRRMRVVDRDAPQTGIQSEIFLVDGKDVSSRVAATDAAGYFSLESKCEPGHQIRARPRSEQYFSESVECASAASEVRVGRMKYIQNLRANAIILEQRSETAEAAFIYNEIAARMASNSTVEAKKAEVKTFELIGLTLGVSAATTYDPHQERTVMTPELKAAIEAFQKSNGIAATGVLDYRTLTVASKRPISMYMYGVMRPEVVATQN